MERNLYRLKAETMPKSPKTAAEIELKFKEPRIMDEWGYSQVFHSLRSYNSVLNIVFSLYFLIV